MTLHPLAEHFSSVADVYERGRPDHPPELVGALRAECGLRDGDRVLDLAAGTGKLTRALLAGGLDVIAVEPQAAMRERLVAAVGAERALDGLAEAIPLPDASLRAVTVADGFHWFDHARALPEIRRVLAPGGALAIVSTLPDWRGASWAHELGGLVMRLRPSHPNFDGPAWYESVAAHDGWSPPRELRVTTMLPADPDRLVDHLASMSWIAGLPAQERAGVLAEIGALVRDGETPAEMPMHFVVGISTRA